MAGVKISASHLKYLQLSRSRWNPIDLQRSAHRFRRCLSTVLPHRSSPGDDSTAHAPSRWQLLGTDRERCYSMASVATISLSPAVKYLVDTNNISDLSLIKPSGPKDRILKGDVLQYLDDIKSGRIPTPPLPTSSTTTIERAAATPAQKISSPPGTLTSTSSAPSVPVIKMDSKTSPVLSYVDIPVDEVQRLRARQMVQSKATVPHVYASASCSVQRLVELAKGLGEDGSGAGGFEAFLIKAAALTLQKLPECNSVWSASEAPQPLSSVDVSVALYSDSGPVTALLKDANRVGVLDLQQTIKRLMDGTQSPPSSQSQSGNFSIIYLGDSGVSDFTAVLGPGQAAVLTIGSVKLSAPGGDASTKSQYTMTVTLTADARVYHDELVCRWLDEFKRTVESPEAYGIL